MGESKKKHGDSSMSSTWLGRERSNGRAVLSIDCLRNVGAMKGTSLSHRAWCRIATFGMSWRLQRWLFALPSHTWPRLTAFATLFPLVLFLPYNTQEYQTMGKNRVVPSLRNLRGFLFISVTVQAWLRTRIMT